MEVTKSAEFLVSCEIAESHQKFPNLRHPEAKNKCQSSGNQFFIEIAVLPDFHSMEIQMNCMQASRDLEGNYEIFFLIAVSHSLLSISLIFSVSAIPGSYERLSKQFILAKLWLTAFGLGRFRGLRQLETENSKFPKNSFEALST